MEVCDSPNSLREARTKLARKRVDGRRDG